MAAKKYNREIRGKTYSLVLLRILEWDAQGRPSKCVIGHDDTTFNLRDENLPREFMTAYVLADMVEPSGSKMKH